MSTYFQKIVKKPFLALNVAKSSFWCYILIKLKKGVKVTGATAHFVNEICDGGPIIIQKAVEILNGDTPEILQKRVMEQAEWKILPKAVSLFCEDKIIVKDNKTEIIE